MGLKGYRLWVMGQLDSTCRAPPDALRLLKLLQLPLLLRVLRSHALAQLLRRILDVAVQVECESKGLKPAFSLYRLKGWSQARSSHGSTGLNLYKPTLASSGVSFFFTALFLIINTSL
jgi:hypothetical protein